jgi:hypothetical protein
MISQAMARLTWIQLDPSVRAEPVLEVAAKPIDSSQPTNNFYLLKLIAKNAHS